MCFKMLYYSISIVLNKLGVYPHGKSTTKLQTLEVGAINTQLQKYPGLSVRAIDIHSQVSDSGLEHFFLVHTLSVKSNIPANFLLITHTHTTKFIVLYMFVACYIFFVNLYVMINYTGIYFRVSSTL